MVLKPGSHLFAKPDSHLFAKPGSHTYHPLLQVRPIFWSVRHYFTYVRKRKSPFVMARVNQALVDTELDSFQIQGQSRIEAIVSWFLKQIGERSIEIKKYQHNHASTAKEISMSEPQYKTTGTINPDKQSQAGSSKAR